MSALDLYRDFRDWRRYRRETRYGAPIAFHPPVGRSGLIGSSQPSPDAILREVLGWADIAVRAVAKRMMQLDLEVIERRSERGGTVVETVLDDHELALLLARFGPTHSRRQALYLLTRYLLELGQAYLLRVGARSGRRTAELHVMQAARVRPVLEGGIVTGYIAQGGTGQEIPLRPEDVIWIWTPDPETLYSAEGVIGPQAQAVDATKYGDAHIREHFQNDATPRVVIESGPEAQHPDPAGRERWEQGWRNAYGLGSTRRGLPAFLPSGFSAKILDEHASTGSVVPIQTYLRDRIFMALGVPRSVVGDVVDANRAAADTNQYVFDLYAVKPYADLIADALTTQLAMPAYGESIAVRFREFVPRDKAHELAREAQDLTLKVRSINEVREERGLDAAAWGELPVGSIADVPYDGEMPEPITVPDDPEALAPVDDEPADPDDAPRRRANVSALDDRLVLGYVRSFEGALGRVFGAQQRRMLEALREAGMGRSARDLSAEEIMSILRRTLAPAGWAQLYDRTTGKVRGATYLAQARRALAQVGGQPGGFVFSAQVATELAAQERVFRKLVSDTTLRDLSGKVFAALKESAEAGEALEARAKRIEAAVAEGMDMRRSRARTIARTEVGTANQIAQLDGWRQSGVVQLKRWVNSQDDAVRDAHEIDGQTVLLEGRFRLRDGIEARAPLDSSLPPGDRINCRCAMVPVTEGETA